MRRCSAEMAACWRHLGGWDRVLAPIARAVATGVIGSVRPASHAGGDGAAANPPV